MIPFPTRSNMIAAETTQGPGDALHMALELAELALEEAESDKPRREVLTRIKGALRALRREPSTR